MALLAVGSEPGITDELASMVCNRIGSACVYYKIGVRRGNWNGGNRISIKYLAGASQIKVIPAISTH